MSNKVVIAFDGEFSGPFQPDKHYMVALGLCAVEFNADGVVTAERFRVCMTPPRDDGTFGFDDRCWREFWAKPEMAEKLAEFQSQARHPSEQMPQVMKWMDLYIRRVGAENARVVCDCVEDATYMNYYVAAFTQHPTLTTFTGSYVGWPLITDDIYRGDLGTLAAWGLDDRLTKKHGLEAVPQGDHDPANDAKEIALRFVGFARKRGLFE